MTPPAVSVVIPVWKQAHFLPEALASVAAQTVLPHEIIVVDDGSPDASASEAATAACPGATFLPAPHGGAASARNYGVARTHGDFLAFLDADDAWEPPKLERQLAALHADGEAAYALCHARYHFDGPRPGWFRSELADQDVKAFVPGAWLVRRSAWERVGLFDPDSIPAEDVDWLARAKDLGLRAAVVEECLLRIRIHSANTQGDVERVHAGLLRALRGSAARSRTP